HFVDADDGGHRVGNLAGVAGDHDHSLDPDRVEVGNCLAGLGTDLVLERDRADDRLVMDEVQHSGTALCPRVDLASHPCGDGEVSFAEQHGPADRVSIAVDGG